ncbi:MAG: Hsp70 family protein [Methylococcaceae bacterium]
MTNPNPDSSHDKPPADDQTKICLGLDLGTTHCVLASLNYSAQDEDNIQLDVITIPQLTNPGVVEEKSQLPSFIYQAHSEELAAGSTTLPWSSNPPSIIGEIARSLGSKTAIRLVSSAKSWLCHTGVDCKAAILPTDAPEEVQRISPFDATTSFLEHIKQAWNHTHPDNPMEQQALTITVPASFDPAARELTIEAAKAVGLNQAILLEEPQSAVYSWIEKNQSEWRKQAHVGDIILVLDIGGGTTDLSLIAVTEEGGNLQLTRVAVGDHILLGGDNMDLALAYTVKSKLEKEGKKLAPWQIQALTHGCREAKEKVFNDTNVNEVPIVVPNRGSSMIGGTLRAALNREEIYQILIEGFLPRVAVSERPASRARTGLITTGLPYAQDAAVTRHLAGFLTKQIKATEELGLPSPKQATFLHPTAVLFNGGVLKATSLAQRMMEVLNSWLEAEQAPQARLLEGADLDLAVARGAAYYNYVRQGKGVRIRGGTAASYYVGVESAMPAVPGIPPELQALCIAPIGMEEGTAEDLSDEEFGLVIGEPVRFRFFASNTRREDKVGTRLDQWHNDELEELDEIEITLPLEDRKPGEIIPVHLCAAVTEVGTLQLEAVASQSRHRWKIEFDVRAGETVEGS